MATLRTILLSLLLACAAQGQTLKSLMYNTTNGQVLANTGTNDLSITNIISLKGAYIGYNIGGYATGGNHAFQVVQTNQGTTMAIAGGSSVIEFWDNNYNNNLPEFAGAIGLAKPGQSATNNVSISDFTIDNGWIEKIRIVSGPNSPIRFFAPLEFGDFADTATTRTNLGLPLAALTNDSSVTMMRALSGSTNANEPYSGTVALTNTNAVLTFSNGILQSVQ